MKQVGLVMMAAMILCGCGGDGSSTAPPGRQPGAEIVGNWNATNGFCVDEVAFDGSGAIVGGNYSMGIVCPLQGGASALQEELGAYSVSGNEIVFGTRQSTCTAAMDPTTAMHAAGPWHVDFAVIDANHLRLMFADSVVVLERNGTVSGSATAALGCIDPATGAFTPGPLGQL